MTFTGGLLIVIVALVVILYFRAKYIARNKAKEDFMNDTIPCDNQCGIGDVEVPSTPVKNTTKPVIAKKKATKKASPKKVKKA